MIYFDCSDPRQQSAPRHIEGPKTYQVNKNQPIVLPCFTEGNPPPTFQYVLYIYIIYLLI